jgi:ABC-type transport system substrate-binding protein
MKEKTVLIALAMVALMIVMVVPVNAWEYWDTGHPITGHSGDLLFEDFGPRADNLQIILYADEAAEFSALELGQIDITDWPVDAAHYKSWVTDGISPNIAVVDTGPEYGMYILDMRMNNETRIYKQIGPEIISDLGPNPAYTAPFGNPMADVWLRRAIAAAIDKKYVVEQIVSGGGLPLLAAPLYTVANDPPYTGYGHPAINPGGAEKELTYLKSDGSADVDLANKFLNDSGYLPLVGGKRTKGGVPFEIELVVRSDHTYRLEFGNKLYKTLTDPMPSGCALPVKLTLMDSSGARVYVMADKKGHMYTGGWGLTIDPDHLYYLFHINNYFHPGRPMNYMYYPGDYEQITVPYDGWQYNKTNIPALEVTVNWGVTPYQLDFSDYSKTYKKNDLVWKNPQNYWSWELMTALDSARAIFSARKSQEAMSFYVTGAPVWASRSFTAFHRTYCGTPATPDGEDKYEGKAWKGVVNQAGFGVWSTFSFQDMHTENAAFGDGSMTIRQGFRQKTKSLNPIYAEWVWDWYVLNQAYDGVIKYDPYQNAYDLSNLAADWKLETWDASALGLGICSKVTFHLRHDLYWSDGMPLTANDVVFTWGGRSVPGSLSSLLYKKGFPPAYWDGQIADILSVAAPDPWTVVVYLDVLAYFALHSMSGFNIVLAEHVWKPLIETGDPTLPWGQPNVCSGAWIIDIPPSEPLVDIWLHKNPYYRQLRDPINMWTTQESKNTLGNAHWLLPGETTMSINVTVHIHNKFVYETGASIANMYSRTILDGTENVTLWKFAGGAADCPNEVEKYVLNRTIATNVPWEAERCIEEVEKYTDLALGPGWYFVKVDLYINSLKYFDGTNWVTVAAANNPFYSDIKTYREFIVVTSRSDIGGKLWKPCPPATPKFQGIPDVKVDIRDVASAAKSFGSYPGHARWDPSVDVILDFKIDIRDIAAIAKGFGWTG